MDIYKKDNNKQLGYTQIITDTKLCKYLKENS